MNIMTVPAALVAALFCVMLLMAVRPLAISLNFVDHPGGRKRHIGKVPLTGGLGMFVGFAAGAVIAAPGIATAYLLAGGWFLLMIGLIDDRFDLPPSVRLGTQFAAVMLMFFGGGQGVVTLGDPLALGTLNVEPVSLLATVFFSVASINALNMTDGLDGLAGSMALVAFVSLAIAGYGTDAMALALVGAAVVLGFLGFNFPMKMNRPVRTFMGDGGSTFLGFVIAWLMVAVTPPPTATISPATALAFVAIPLYDLTSCFFRRILDGRSPMSADRNHYHHILLGAGIRRRAVLAIMVSAAVAVATICGALEASGAADSSIFVAWIACGLLIDGGLRILQRRAAGIPIEN